MPNALYIWIFCWVTICVELSNRCSGQEDVLEFNNRSFGLWRSNERLKYTEVECPNGNRTISYDDVMNIEKRLLTQSAFTTSVWVNATASYTPWVVYRGIYRIAEVHVINSTRVSNMTQFIDCVQFCSVYSWQYIGLQEDKCYCLSSNALSKTLRISYNTTLEKSVKICRDGDIMYCTTRNNNYSMVVYEKDNNTYDGDGECLRSNIQPDSLVSVAPSPCNTQDTFIMCLNKQGTYSPSSEMKITRRLSYCDVFDMTFVDFHTLNSSKISNSVYNRHYWLNSLRASIFSKPVSGQALHAHCVVGMEVDGKIKLQITGCGNKKYALCIGHNHIFDKTTDEVITTQMNNNKVSVEFDVTTTSKARDIDGSSEWMIIVAGVSVFILISIITILIAIRLRKPETSTSAHGPLYATVRKETLNKSNLIKHGDRPDVENALIEEDNTYDHSNFRMRQPLQQTDPSNYDTMRNVLPVTGESIYHHTITFKTSTGIIQDDESVYHHAANFNLSTANEQK